MDILRPEPLAPFTLQYRNYKGDGKQKNKWPNQLKEIEYYKPFCSILEEIREAFDDGRNVSHGRHFVTYDRVMRDCVENSHPMKPDILVLSGPIEKEDHSRWEEPIMVCEVKRDGKDLVRQAATYARAMLSARPNRHIAFVILLNHVKGEVQFSAFHRGGMVITEPMEIRSLQGYENLVHLTVAFLMCTEYSSTIGEDHSRDAQKLMLPDGRIGVMTEILFNCPTLRGRATYVSTLRVQDAIIPIKDSERPRNNNPIFTLRSRSKSPSRTSPTRTRLSRSQTSSSVSSIDQVIENMRQSSLDDPVPSFLLSTSMDREPSSGSMTVVPAPDTSISFYTLPAVSLPHLDTSFEWCTDGIAEEDELVMKESWPLRMRCNDEYRAFSGAKGYCGIPEIVGRWIIAPASGRGYYPGINELAEQRVLQRILMKPRGESLLCAKSPKHFIEAILHGFIEGHWKLFQDGWLHCDISIGNLLLLEKPIRRKIHPGLHDELPDEVDCFGIVIDGDNMTPLVRSGDDSESGFRLSGTPPFMSRRLHGRAFPATKQLVFDDIESFGWTIFYGLLEILSSQSLLGPCGSLWLSDLGEISQKGELVSQLCHRNLDEIVTMTGIPISLVQLLQSWFLLCEVRHDPEPDLEKKQEEEWKKPNLYKSHVELLLHALKMAPQ
ncbi:hypothetical protein FRC17_003619, partial [Serendipita sp. 399]